MRRALRALDLSLRRLVPMLQGQYMGYMRQLKPHRKARVRKIREAKGVRAAVNQAKHLAHS